MRVSKLYSTLLIAFLTIGFVACTNTVSSTDTSDTGGLDYIPGFNPGKPDSSKVADNSSSSDAESGSESSSSDTEESSSEGEEPPETESSSSEEESSSSIDFSESEVSVEGGVAVITEEFLDTDLSVDASDLDEMLDDEDPAFEEFRSSEFSVDDFVFESYEYYCYTQSHDWLQITKEKLLETKLPILWDGSAYDARDGYFLSFEGVCESVFLYALPVP